MADLLQGIKEIDSKEESGTITKIIFRDKYSATF